MKTHYDLEMESVFKDFFEGIKKIDSIVEDKLKSEIENFSSDNLIRMISMLEDLINDAEEKENDDIKESYFKVLRAIYCYCDIEEVLLEIIKIHPIAILYKFDKSSIDFLIDAIRVNPESFKYMRDKVSIAVMEEAINQDVTLYRYIKSVPVYIMKKVVEEYPEEIVRFKNAPNSVWSIAIKQNPKLAELKPDGVSDKVTGKYGDKGFKVVEDGIKSETKEEEYDPFYFNGMRLPTPEEMKKLF